MGSLIVTLAVGALICFFGVRNMMGDISSLHSYHRNRVSAEDVKPFGKLVGIGTVICGISVIVMGIFTFIAEITGFSPFMIIGMVLLILGMIAGLGISFYAMKKYNGGIFG